MIIASYLESICWHVLHNINIACATLPFNRMWNANTFPNLKFRKCVKDLSSHFFLTNMFCRAVTLKHSRGTLNHQHVARRLWTYDETLEWCKAGVNFPNAIWVIDWPAGGSHSWQRRRGLDTARDSWFGSGSTGRPSHCRRRARSCINSEQVVHTTEKYSL